MSTNDLERRVTEELEWEPRLDAEAIAVFADKGVVTLRGTVGSFREKLEAKRAAQRVHGVTKVENALEVRLMNGNRRGDAELRGEVLQALMIDSLVPSTIDANVKDGVVTLTGRANSQFERDEATSQAGKVRGVMDLSDEIELDPTPDAGDVKHSIKKAFERSARLDAEDLSVTSAHGTVTLEGVVSSWAEHDEAVAAAWAAPGVKKVHDLIQIGY